MSKKKKIIIGSSLGVAAIIIIALLMVFVFDTFGMFTSEYKLNYDKYVTIGGRTAVSPDVQEKGYRGGCRPTQIGRASCRERV